MVDVVSLQVGQRVRVVDTGAIGVVAYVGTTEFATGKWVGVNLDDAKGKNNGTVQGKSYFECPDHHGIFVRALKLALAEQSPGPGSKNSSPEDGKSKPRSRLPIFGLGCSFASSSAKDSAFTSNTNTRPTSTNVNAGSSIVATSQSRIAYLSQSQKHLNTFESPSSEFFSHPPSPTPSLSSLYYTPEGEVTEGVPKALSNATLDKGLSLMCRKNVLKNCFLSSRSVSFSTRLPHRFQAQSLVSPSKSKTSVTPSASLENCSEISPSSFLPASANKSTEASNFSRPSLLLGTRRSLTKPRITKTWSLSNNSLSPRLPVAGNRDPKDSPKSLQSTPSGSRSNLSIPASAKLELGSKRASFIETGFAPEREIIPQYTPGTPASVLATPVSTPVVLGGGGSDDRYTIMLTVEAQKNEIKDLNEKLETLKVKRAADLEKIREVDRLRLEVETLNEFRTKVLESQAALQRDLKQAKNEARDAIEAKEQHAEEMSELSEAVEMATLDKEMAEEKAETLQLELEQSNEKVEELSTELKTLKDEISGKVNLDSGEVTSMHVKQLQAENARLREALVKLRDTSAHEKHQHQKTLKDAETFKADVKELSRTKERLEARCQELESQVTDLQEQNDAALGAEEMVENLTEKNLNLEEKVGQLVEAVTDLEALQDVNDQLQESAKELEMELREELQQAIAANTSILREKEALLETVSDQNATILKFRDAVKKLTDQNVLLRRNLEEESAKSIPGLMEALDFKKVFAETKAQTTAIDLELRRLEAKEAAQHVKYLSAFMPEGFMKRGGDNDAVMVLLLVPRMVCKVEILLTQVREKLIPSSLAEGAPSGEAIATSPDVERYAFCTQFCFLLYTLISELHRWFSALNTCTAENFLKIGTLYSDLMYQERAVDFYLELLRKSQLDENIPLESMEKCIMSFQNYYSSHLADEQVETSTLVSDLCVASVTACDCIVTDVNRLIWMLKKSEKESKVAALLQDLKTIGESLRQLAKRTRRYLPDPPKQPPVTNKLQSQLINDSVTLTKVVKILQEACKQALRHSVSGSEGIPSSKVEEFLQAAMEKCDSRAEGSGGIKEVIKEWLTTSLMTMTDLAQVVNEAPVLPKDKPQAPITVRSQAVKSELDQTRNLKIQLEDKEATIKELRKIVRAKQDELSEASIRKELAEKKLSNAIKDSEMTIEKLTRKLEDSQSMLLRKEREFEATLEHFQSDIEVLESERGELREKLVSVSKESLLERIARSAAASPLHSPIHNIHPSIQSQMGGNGNIGGVPSSGLIEYTRHLQRQNWRLQSQKFVEIMKNLPPLQLPSKKPDEELKALEREFSLLKHEHTKILCDSLRIKFNPEYTPARKQYLISLEDQKKIVLAEKMANLKHRINMKAADRKSVHVVKADFAAFSTERSKKDRENEIIKVGSIKFPGWEKSSEKPTRLILTESQLQTIHKLLTSC